MRTAPAALTLGPAERERLIAGAAAVGVRLDAGAVDRFGRYAELLGQWGSKTNLISCRTAAELVDRHFVDSLMLAPLLPEHASVVDLGSGAGFPGVPLAIVRALRCLVLVESRRRRASFLREVRRNLTLDKTLIVEARAEHGPEREGIGLCDAAVCRAVWSDEAVLPIAARWLRPSGRLFWMRASSRVALGRALVESARGEMVFEHEYVYRLGGKRSGVVAVFRRRR